MSTEFPELFAALARPFEGREIKQRQAGGGRRLDYITARTVMNRLDEVLGPENWEDDYDVSRGDAWICKLTVVLPDGRTVTKQGVGVNSKSVGEDAEKGGESDALKRAAAKFGVGRHLYQDGIVDFAAKGVDSHASSGHNQPPARDEPRTPPPAARDGASPGDLPRTGRALFAWASRRREQAEREGRKLDLIKVINAHGDLERFPKRMVDWDADQVASAVAKCLAILESPPPAPAPKPTPPSPRHSDGSPVVSPQDDDIPF